MPNSALSALPAASALDGNELYYSVQSATDVKVTGLQIRTLTWASPTFTGHVTAEGVTSTGATGTGRFVFDNTPTLITPVLGVATATSLAIGGATIGANAFAVTGTSLFNSAITYGGVTLANSVTGTGSMVLSIAPTITGHPTIEGVTSTGATGTGKFVFDTAPTISGHPTIEGVTSTGATGTGKFVFDNAPTLTGHPTIEGVTSTGATGTGRFVFDNTPTLITPNIGAATGTSLLLTARYATAEVALVDGATPALDASLGNLFTLSAAGDRTIAVPSNATSGQKIVIRHLASGGARTLSLNTGANGFRFGTDITGLTQTASGKTDYIGCIWNVGASFWDVVAYTKGF